MISKFAPPLAKKKIYTYVLSSVGPRTNENLRSVLQKLKYRIFENLNNDVFPSQSEELGNSL